jgi:hypothetical protein
MISFRNDYGFGAHHSVLAHLAGHQPICACRLWHRQPLRSRSGDYPGYVSCA